VIRFHLDEHIDPAIASALRRHGIDVTTPVEAGLLAASDDAHLDFALAERRVLVTSGADFLRLHRLGRQHAGIVYLPHSRSVGEIVNYLRTLEGCVSTDEIIGQVEYC
jgi:predicted nuclease of predicted toxin-antitoxin system